MTEYTMTEYTMTDAMTERLPPYNFSVSGLVSTDHVLSLIQGLISHISSRIGSDDVDLKSIIVRHPNDVPEALLELDIGEDIVDDFCDEFWQPSTFSMLRSVSEYGLFGFQATKGTDLAEHWHRAACKSTFMYGSERMREFHDTRLKFKDFTTIPMWAKVAVFVADTCLEASLILSINPSNIDDCLAKRQRRLEQKSSVTEQVHSWAASLLGMDKQKVSGTPITRAMYDNLFFKIRQICTTLGMAQGGETPGLTMARRRDLFLDLYALTEEACKTLSATEEGIRIYVLEVRLAQGQGVLSVGALATCCWRACSTQTLMPMLGVPFSLAWLLKTVQKGYKSQKKEDQCRKLAHLIWQTWNAAAETSRFLAWIHTTNHEVAFVGRHGRDWDAYLTEKAGEEIPDNLKSAGYLQVYMRDRLDELKKTEEQMRKSSETICELIDESEEPDIDPLPYLEQISQVWQQIPPTST